MNPEHKKIIASALAAGTLVAGGMTVADRARMPHSVCDYTIEGECVTQAQVDAVKTSILKADFNSVQTWDD